MTSEPSSATRLIFDNFEQALSFCQSGGYDDEELAAVVVEKNKIYRERLREDSTIDLSAARSLIGSGISIKNDRLNVLDFGGGGGYHYWIAKRGLSPDVKFKWNVVETPCMSARAMQLQTTELKFFDDINEAAEDLGNIDLVFSSGALQYCANPLGVIESLANLGSRQIFFTRTAFYQGDQRLVIIQKSKLSENGPGLLPPKFVDRIVLYPSVFDPINKVKNVMVSAGYKTRFRMIEEVGYLVGDHPIYMIGMFFDLDSTRSK